MIISVNGREKKIAIVENGQTTEFYIERGEDNSGVVGNIYKGRVQRVLPGMQSAFVDIGLERDAFLYVSDFFDEEEEIERIVLEKKNKEQKSDDEADREATDEIHKTRLKRDKKIDNVQEKLENAPELSVEDDDDKSDESDKSDKSDNKDNEQRKPSRRRSGRQRRGGKNQDPAEESKDKSKDTGKDTGNDKNKDEDSAESKQRGRNERPSRDRKPSQDRSRNKPKRENELDASTIEIGDSSFERIVDEDEDTGEMLKDAMMQEAITDKVRSIEFDMETVEYAEVGSLIDGIEESGFKRIADEDEEETPKKKPARGRSRKTSARGKKAPDQEGGEDETESKPKTRGRKSSTTRKSTARKKAADKEETGEDGDDSTTKKKPATRRRASSRKKKEPVKKSEEKTNADLEGSEASVKSTEDVSEMAVRRGSRGGRRTDTSPAKSRRARQPTWIRVTKRVKGTSTSSLKIRSRMRSLRKHLAAAAAGQTVHSRKFRICSAKVRKFWFRLQRNRSPAKAPESHRTLHCPADSWFICRPSNISGFRVRSNRPKKEAVFEIFCKTSSQMKKFPRADLS